jgi:DNA-cytosine methyltransferase
MSDGINVLSLFDGMSCGQIALERICVSINNYYASELDKYAIAVTQVNYPDTIQLGDVTKWREWNVDWSSIDLLIGGSPCQGFSFAGKQLAFDDPRSALFFVYVDILNYIRKHNPDVNFILENVRMKQEYLDIISEQLGVQPVKINSALVSAQNRVRCYWVNWDFGQPEDIGIVLRDILESGVVDRHKSHCLDANYWKGGNLKSYFEKHRRQLVFEAKNGKAVTIEYYQIFEPVTFYETRTKFGKKEKKRLSNLLGRDTTPRCKKSKHYVVQTHNKSNCIVTVDSFLNWIIDDAFYCRKLTPIECERLQTVPDNYTNHVSNTQRYKMLGNGWTVDVVAHIFKSMESHLK